MAQQYILNKRITELLDKVISQDYDFEEGEVLRVDKAIDYFRKYIGWFALGDNCDLENAIDNISTMAEVLTDLNDNYTDDAYVKITWSPMGAYVVKELKEVD